MELMTPAGEAFNIYLAGAEKASKGVLIIHDWWGLIDYNCEWANRFAQAGYRAMAIDLYNGHHPTGAKEAGEYSRQLDQETINRKVRTALQTLKTFECQQLAVLGWSFGGVQAQQAMLQNRELVNAIVLYYCRIILDREKAPNVSGPVLAIFAETERTWPDKQASLEHVMAESGKVLECHSYDADHSFINPDGLRYDSEAAESAWQVTLTFLNKYFELAN